MVATSLSSKVACRWLLMPDLLAILSKDWTKHFSNYLQWLIPGLLIKRWLLLSVVGLHFVFFGLEAGFRLIPWDILWLPSVQNLENSDPSLIDVVFELACIPLGLWFYLSGQVQAVRSITEVSQPAGEAPLIELLKTRRRLNRGPRIVAIGGGTGLSTLLRGLKHYSDNITAIVTVADDGGSSGRLRRDIGILPPGDIRSCLTALADEEKLLTELFQYRFQDGDHLAGHSFGNLFLTAMSSLTGDFEHAIAASSKVLAARGRVLPASLSNIQLWAKLTDGRYIEGESKISEAKGQISEIGCWPANPPTIPAVIKAIQEADCIVIGPGSLYTSIIPNLLVPEIRDAIANAKVPRIYVCNIMTQPGETDGYTVSDHIRALNKVGGRRLFDAVLVHQTASSPAKVSLKFAQETAPSTIKSLLQYAKERSQLVTLDPKEVANLGCQVVLADVLDRSQGTSYVRHSSSLLAAALMRWFQS